MVDKLLQGQGIVADSPILPGTWAYYDGITHIGFDPDAAIARTEDRRLCSTGKRNRACQG